MPPRAPRPATRLRVLEAAILLGLLGILARSAQLQLVHGAEYARQAAAKRTETEVLEAPRGTILDRNGQPLAVTQEFYRIGVAPNELRDRERAVRLVARATGRPRGSVARDLQRERWAYYGGPYSALEVDSLRGLRGVYLERTYLRAYPARQLARRVIGAVDDTGRGASGLELALDSLLTGVPGEAVVLKSPGGRRFDSPARVRREPRAGEDVVLTLDGELQDMAEFGLEETITTFDAAGGDVVILEPYTGELLAVASRQRRPDGRFDARPTAFTDPYQPGSTAKLFTAAALLDLGLVDSADTEDGECGTWEMPITERRTRTITDDHELCGPVSLELAIMASSNIAMAKFAQRLSIEQHYEALRGFGFGSPSGVEFPADTRGQLQPAHRWNPLYSRASVAYGYEFSLTPVQLAAAYAAIANDGILLAPSLVREVRAPDGTVTYRHEPEPVRRAVSPAVATQLRSFLAQVVSDTAGTGGRARLVSNPMGGKTGTTRGSRPGEYTASWAAIYPIADPQLVMVIKVDNPRRSIYGGSVAAPLSKSIVTWAMAARTVSIDRARLADSPSVPVRAPARREREEAPVVSVAWPAVDSAVPGAPREVPEVVGLDYRQAARVLHRAGFHVTTRGEGPVRQSSPTAGTRAAAGATVVLWGGG